MIIIPKIHAINFMGTHLGTHVMDRSLLHSATTLTAAAAVGTLPTASAVMATVLMPPLLHTKSLSLLQLSKTFSLQCLTYHTTSINKSCTWWSSHPALLLPSHKYMPLLTILFPKVCHSSSPFMVNGSLTVARRITSHAPLIYWQTVHSQIIHLQFPCLVETRLQLLWQEPFL